jgi:DNA-binding response OmpR family regulator
VEITIVSATLDTNPTSLHALQPPLLTVGVLEDNDDLRSMLVTLLSSHGYRIVQAYCADELDELLRSSPVDVLLADINLPGEDGLSVARRYKNVFPSLKIIMMTTRIQVQDRIRGYDAGADIYLPKPFDQDELLAALRAVIRQSSNMLQNQQLPVLDVAAQKITGPAGTVDVNPIDVKMIVGLSIAEDQILEYWQLMELMGDEDREIDKGTLFVHVNRLREKLKRAGMPDDTIKSVRLRGYRLMLPVIVDSGRSPLSPRSP